MYGLKLTLSDAYMHFHEALPRVPIALETYIGVLEMWNTMDRSRSVLGGASATRTVPGTAERFYGRFVPLQATMCFKLWRLEIELTQSKT